VSGGAANPAAPRPIPHPTLDLRRRVCHV